MPTTYHRSFPNGLDGKYAKVARRLPSASSVLEIGCHTGYFSHVLMDLGHQVLGIENDHEAARLARAQGVPVTSGNVEDPSIISQLRRKFDVVLLMDVLEHLRDPLDLLKRIKIALADHGRVIITGPNIAYWAVRKDLVLGRWNYCEAGILDRNHLHFYTALTWKALIAEAGYEIRAFEPAESMIPLEHILFKIPLVRAITPFLRNLAERLSPELFAIVFLIEASPAERSSRQFP